VSDSARSTTGAEFCFRVQAPNAAARGILVAALDAVSQRLLRDLQSDDWHGLDFVDVSSWRPALEVRAVDVLIIVSSAAQSAEAAREIGSHAMKRAINVSTVLLREGVDLGCLARALQQLQPWTRTLTVLEDEADLEGVLHALGA